MTGLTDQQMGFQSAPGLTDAQMGFSAPPAPKGLTDQQMGVRSRGLTDAEMSAAPAQAIVEDRGDFTPRDNVAEMPSLPKGGLTADRLYQESQAAAGRQETPVQPSKPHEFGSPEFEASYAEQQRKNAIANPPSHNPIRAGIQAAKTSLAQPLGVVSPDALAQYEREQTVEHPVADTLLNKAGGTVAGAGLGALEYLGGGAPLMAAEAGLAGAGQSRVDTRNQREAGIPEGGLKEAAQAIGTGGVDAATAYVGGKMLGGRPGRGVAGNIGAMGGLSATQQLVKNLINERPTRENVTQAGVEGSITQGLMHGAVEGTRYLAGKIGGGGEQPVPTAETSPTKPPTSPTEPPTTPSDASASVPPDFKLDEPPKTSETTSPAPDANVTQTPHQTQSPAPPAPTAQVPGEGANVPERAKQPWEMTLRESWDASGKKGDTGPREMPAYEAVNSVLHKQEWITAVQNALLEGKPVPEPVVSEMMQLGDFGFPQSRVKDYPNIAKNYRVITAEPTPPQTTHAVAPAMETLRADTAPTRLSPSELNLQLRNQVMEHFGRDAGDINTRNPYASGAWRGDLPPGYLISLDKARDLAAKLPEDHPARITLHNIEQIEKNPAKTRIKSINTNDAQDGTRVVMNDGEIVTIDKENQEIADGIRAPIPEGGIDVYGKKVLPPVESPNVNLGEDFFTAPEVHQAMTENGVEPQRAAESVNKLLADQQAQGNNPQQEQSNAATQGNQSTGLSGERQGASAGGSPATGGAENRSQPAPQEFGDQSEKGVFGQPVITSAGEPPAPSEPAPERQAEPPSDATGIAHRVNEAKGLAIPRGQGIGAEESVQLGRKEYAAIGGAEKVADWMKGDAPPDQKIRVARAHAEFLDKAANKAADQFGIKSPEYASAAKTVRDWKADVIKPMSTEAHRGFVAHQGETDIDTGTFHGIASAYREAKGTELTQGETQKAQRLAASAQAADAAVEATGKKIVEAVDKHVAELAPAVRSLADRIVAKLDTAANAAWERFKARNSGTTLRSGIDPADLKDLSIYGAAKIAKGITRFAEWSAEMIKDVGESIRPHLKTIWDAADKHLDEHIANNSPKARADNLRQTIRKTPVDLSAHEPGTKMSPERVKALWDKAKADYIDKGNANFIDIANKLATDTGIPVSDIRRALAGPKEIRKITNDMYAAQSRRRSVDQQARAWVRNAGTPLPLRIVKGIPSAFFSVKVFGHGTVGMVTHAGNQIFDPVVAKQYWTNFARQFKFVGSRAAHEQAMQDLEHNPNFITARRAGLANDPGLRDEYQAGLLGKVGLGGNRGFDALKTMRQDLFDRAWRKAPESLKTPEYAKELASSINHATGYGANPLGTGVAGKVATSVIFSPRLEGSRWSFLVGDPVKAIYRLANWKNEKPEFRAAAIKEVRQKATIAASYFAALAANQAILMATGSKDKINYSDPSKPDWLDFKGEGHRIGIISPMKNTVKFFVNMATAMYGNRKNLHGDSRADKVSATTGKYIRGKASPFGSVLYDAATQSDFEKRPVPWSSDPVPKYLRNEGVQKYSYGEYVTQTLLPMPVEDAMKEVWQSQGASGSTMRRWLHAIRVGAIAGSTGIRVEPDLKK